MQAPLASPRCPWPFDWPPELLALANDFRRRDDDGSGWEPYGVMPCGTAPAAITDRA